MATNLELIQEAVRRGLTLPPDKEAMYNEAVKRGLVKDERISTGADVGWSLLSSVPKALTGIVGGGADLGDALYGGLAYGSERLSGATPEDANAKKDAAIQARRDMRQGIADSGIGPAVTLPPGTSVIRKGLEDRITGPLYDPKTVPGEYADTTGQFVTGAALFGSGGILPRFIQGAVPALVTETTGQTARKVAPEWEGTARLVSGLASGLATNALTATKSVGKVISDASKGATPDQINKAIILMRESSKAGGVPLTFPEAVQHVTNGATTLDDVARFVENSRNGGPTMRKFFADRPQAVENAFNRQANRIDPNRSVPEVIGPRVQQGAQGYLDEVNAGINATTKPLYDTANPVRLGYRDMRQILANPAYLEKVKELRSHPYLGNHFKNVKANSVEMIDAVKKLMDKDIEALAMAPKGIDRFAGAAATGQKKSMVNIAKNASQEYDDALRIQADLRQNALEPLQQGQTGKLAATDQLQRQLGEVFPTNPLPNSEKGVRQAIRAIARKDPTLASNLVGAHIDQVFAEAGQKLVSGVNSGGGAKFAAVLAGNSQQAKNLEAAIRALPGGDSKWIGFKKLLNNLEATGRRKPVGSPTDLNQAIRADLKAGGPIGTTLSTIASPGRLTTRMMDSYQAWRLGRNTGQLARMFTDPRAADELGRLAMMKPGTAEFTATVARIEMITRAGNSREE